LSPAGSVCTRPAGFADHHGTASISFLNNPDEKVVLFLQVIKGWDQGIVGGEGIPPMLAGS
jgi:hypothetical protein